MPPLTGFFTLEAATFAIPTPGLLALAAWRQAPYRAAGTLYETIRWSIATSINPASFP